MSIHKSRKRIGLKIGKRNWIANDDIVGTTTPKRELGHVIWEATLW